MQAEDFLLQRPYTTTVDKAPPGALYIQEPSASDQDLSLGIYLNPQVQQALGSFPAWPTQWNGQQLSAFGLAAEEVSHFHYVAHHAPQGRGVSQLELELQGEIDRFLITLFANPLSGSQDPFSQLLDSFFQNFHWVETLSSAERARYEEAHRVAKAFLSKHADLIQHAPKEKLLKLLREFYRLSLEDKISQATR